MIEQQTIKRRYKDIQIKLFTFKADDCDMLYQYRVTCKRPESKGVEKINIEMAPTYLYMDRARALDAGCARIEHYINTVLRYAL